MRKWLAYKLLSNKWLMYRSIRRMNKRHLDYLHRERIALLSSGESHFERQAEIRRDIGIILLKSEVMETRILLEKAIRLGIDIPSQKGWWKDEDEYKPTSSIQMLIDMEDRHLTELGKAGVAKLTGMDRMFRI
jgi:hypothetical protein